MRLPDRKHARRVKNLRRDTTKQDTDNQRRELEAVAARSGWHVVKVYEDAGITGGARFSFEGGVGAVSRGSAEVLVRRCF